MNEATLGRQRVLFDNQKTQAGYSSMSQGGADDCGCSYCRNFIAQRSQFYPADVLAIFRRLGVDPRKEGEVYECGPAEDKKRQYGGWLFFVGELLEGTERTISDSGLEYWIGSGDNLPSPKGTFDDPLLVFEFWTSLPWIIEDEI